MFPAIIGSNFPGALYLTQTLKFRKPALVGSSITAEVRVSSKSGKRVTFETTCRDDAGGVIVDGTALALIKEQQDGS
jgi:3-hydroxybutyryl-CoA dehydratase